MVHGIINWFFAPGISHNDPVRQWRLNAFYRLLSVFLLFCMVPAAVVLGLLHWWNFLGFTITSILTFLFVFFLLRKKRLATAVNAFNIIGVITVVVVMIAFRLNDPAYILFYVVLLAGIFLGLRHALVWTAVCTGVLLGLTVFYEWIAILPPVETFAGGIRFARSSSTHISTALNLIWIAVFISWVFQSYFAELLGKIVEHNRDLENEIDRRARTEQSLLLSESRYRTLVDTSLQGLAILQNGKIAFCNSSFAETLGYTVEEVCALSPKEVTALVHEDYRDHLFKPENNVPVSGTGRLIFQESKLYSQDGEIRWVESSAVNTSYKEAPAVQITTIDVTDRKLAEEHRARLEERLRQAEKMEAIGQLAGGVAHDFNNQLTGVIGYAQMLSRKAGDNPMVKEYCKRILRAVERSSGLTSQLLAFARKGKYLLVEVDMHATIHEVVGILKHSINKQVVIREHLQADPHFTKGDPTQLQNALLNLSLNACDAMPEGGELTFYTQTVEFDREMCSVVPFNVEPGSYLRIQVRDTGTGMDETVIKHMFEPFFTTKEKGKGTGMGLAAVYGTVKNHRGTVEVKSAPGKGTTFTINLPLSTGKTKQKRPPTTAVPVEARGTAHILFVDDERDIREAAVEMLEQIGGYKVTVAENGKDAVTLYEKNRHEYDLVVLDINMPKMGGGEAFCRLKQINPQVRAVLSSGFGLDGEAQKILNRGVAAFIQKPYEYHDLVKVIGDTIGRPNGKR